MSLDYADLDKICDYCREFLSGIDESQLSDEEQEVVESMDRLCDDICDLIY